MLMAAGVSIISNPFITYFAWWILSFGPIKN